MLISTYHMQIYVFCTSAHVNTCNEMHFEKFKLAWLILKNPLCATPFRVSFWAGSAHSTSIGTKLTPIHLKLHNILITQDWAAMWCLHYLKQYNEWTIKLFGSTYNVCKISSMCMHIVMHDHNFCIMHKILHHLKLSNNSFVSCAFLFKMSRGHEKSYVQYILMLGSYLILFWKMCMNKIITMTKS